MPDLAEELATLADWIEERAANLEQLKVQAGDRSRRDLEVTRMRGRARLIRLMLGRDLDSKDRPMVSGVELRRLRLEAGLNLVEGINAVAFFGWKITITGLSRYERGVALDGSDLWANQLADHYRQCIVKKGA